MPRDHVRGRPGCTTPGGKFVNREKGCFTFVHVAESRAKAIANGAAWSALWYVNAAPVVFKVPRRIWYDMIKAGLHPYSAKDTAAVAARHPPHLPVPPAPPHAASTLHPQSPYPS